MRIPEVSYPGLVAVPERTTHGSLVMELSAEEWIALDEYDDDFYRCVPLEAVSADGSTTVAYGFVVDQDVVAELEWTREWFEENHLSLFAKELNEQ